MTLLASPFSAGLTLDESAGTSGDIPMDENGRTRLLMIDDDRKLCRLVSDYLSPLGFDVTAVHTGPEGV